MYLKIKRLTPEAQMPKRGSIGAAGLDLYAPLGTKILIYPRSAVTISLGIASEFPSDWVALIHDRGSMGLKGIMRRAGVIDCDYRGEWMIRLWNGNNDDTIEINAEKACAQVILMPCWMGEPEFVDQINESVRGAGMNGSTNRRAA